MVLPACKDSLETTVILLTKFKNLDHFGYERKGVWHIGIGSWSSLRVDPKGETAVITGQGMSRNVVIPGSLTDFTRDFVTQQSQQYDGKIFGQVGFNFGAHVRGQSYTPGRWPILSVSKQPTLVFKLPILLWLLLSRKEPVLISSSGSGGRDHACR
jgi:salicylate synthetase